MEKNAYIRSATPTDIDDILQLCALHAQFERETFSLTKPNGESTKTALAELLFGDSPAIGCLLVEQDGEVVGYATYAKQFSTWQARSYLYLDCMFLKEHTRGQGLGTKLMEQVRSEGLKMGCEQLQWQTPVFNQAAIGFYKHIGAQAKTKERFVWMGTTD